MGEINVSNILPDEKVKSLVQSWLAEDTPNFDYGGLVVGHKMETAELLIKSPGIVAGVPFFDAVFQQLGCEVKWLCKEGSKFESCTRERIATVTGPCKNILLGERIALNCISRASGVATIARRYLEIVGKTDWKGKIAGTRKTTPGFRLVEKYSLLVAGADTHRYNLSSMVMLKDNHIWSSGSITKAVEATKSVSGFSTKIEVECQSLEEGLEAARAGADVVMFDNFKPENLMSAAKTLKSQFPYVLVEASGGIDEENISSYCVQDVDVISTSKLIQGYPAVDFSLKIIKKSS
ncbi:nicotinate-nucleotide pyrophosphorylase [carboxylating]-like [Clavelina lepadiformis]|uniref:nicotinate-nucleotide pyrophosphorylase [carboxylating]-like n=1 Tax=Clavelina lepadiformis TaxID=159417 RepID=UPI00404244E1